MASQVVHNVAKGFSTTNRWLLHTSLMLTPAQLLSGLGSKSPINIRFLAYNIYTQYSWYITAKQKELHALSLLPEYLNFLYAVTYLGGIPSGHMYLTILSGVGTVGLGILNNITAWVSLRTNLPEGDGVDQFFFLGWRRLTRGWRKFFLMWAIADTMLILTTIYYVVDVVLLALTAEADANEGRPSGG
ncbi:hypothetical protein BJ165DRAFT_1607951 [Panaeolus papilionaceus]|nr:hypothetical protein BJ165DRAFT_1607951 [Panaeolus papilionaceus]